MKKNLKFIFGAIISATLISSVMFFGYLFPRDKLFSDYIENHQVTEQAESASEELSDSSAQSSEGEIENE